MGEGGGMVCSSQRDARSSSLQRMVRRYVLGWDIRQPDAKTGPLGGPEKSTGIRSLAARPGSSGGRRGRELRTQGSRRDARSHGMQAAVHTLRGVAPNDPKLSDSGVRRGTCMVGGKAAVEAGAVTHGAVRCSAWLGVAVGLVDGMSVNRLKLWQDATKGCNELLGSMNGLSEPNGIDAPTPSIG